MFCAVQGPLNWSMDAEPQVLFAEPFTPAPRHSSNKQLLQREYARLGQPGKHTDSRVDQGGGGKH
jgi:hypothetical protein